MWTLVAFDADGNVTRATLTELTGEADDHVRVVGNDIYVPELNRMIGVYALHKHAGGNGNASQARISSPSLRAVALEDLTKIDNIAQNYNPEVGLSMRPLNPIRLVTNEALNALMIDVAVATTRSLVGVFLADGFVTPITGEIHTVRCTAEVDGVAGEWASGNITFGEDLPVGRYQIVGACVSLDGACGLFRFIPVGGRWRPGGVMQRGMGDGRPDLFRDGRLGVWLEFDQLTPPRLEVLHVTAVNDPVVYLDLIKIA